ncbi:MAG TPA: sigma-70 family RNA polymerase sigma factor [Candidatus Elarobacter sp.]|jgi:RNA polymerase sigma-B factor|nr:sigma-70 family RNA polymerase sigma factor [Candidatus Elarobacter sp.]
MIQRDVVVARYCAERTVERRNAVVDAYRHLCSRGARKFKRSHNDRADLEQVAAVGLIKAAANYRPEMQTPFQAYAWIMIVGELMHYVRDHERIVRAPRSLLALERRYLAAWDAFASRNHREPTACELAAALGVTVETVSELRTLRRGERVSLPEPDSDDGPERVDLLADTTIGIALEERIALALAVDRLGDRERTIVLGTYGAGLTQSELGARLGLSQSHVSKLLSRALHKLGSCVA